MSWTRWMPAQQPLRQFARGGAVQCKESAQETEMPGRLFERNGYDRQTQVAADDLRDFPHRYPLLTDAVQPTTRRRRLHRQAEEMGGIEPVHRRPAV